MQLALTADKRFWSPSSQTLLLGEWCRLYKNPQENLKVLSYPWDDRKKYHDDSLWLSTVNDLVLRALAKSLNEALCTSYSPVFWKILLGPWTLEFVPLLYERYLSIVKAGESGLVTEVHIARKREQPIRDTHAFLFEAVEDPYNLHLYSEIIRLLSPFAFIQTNLNDSSNQSTRTVQKKTSKIKQVLKKAAFLWSKAGASNHAGCVFVASYLSKKDLFWIQLALGQWPIPDTLPDFKGELSFEPTLRKSLADAFSKHLGTQSRLESAEKNFRDLLKFLIPQELPLIFLEGFQPLFSFVSKNFKNSRPETIFTSNAHISHEAFKMWAALSKEKGTRLLLSQHGGHTGTGLWCHSEEHERSISDHYFTWGWEEDPKTLPLPTGKLSRFQVSPKKSGKILLVLNSFPRYFYRSYSIPIAAQTLSYLKDQKGFIENLCGSARDLLEVRPYPMDFGWSEWQRLKDVFHDLKKSDTQRTFANDLNGARLFIGNHNTTTFLESLSANFPSILFWNPNHWELRPEARSYFDLLVSAGILFSDPKSAALKTNTIFEDPQQWWNSDPIQKARLLFCDRFAKTDPQWKKAWVQTFSQTTVPKPIPSF